MAVLRAPDQGIGPGMGALGHALGQMFDPKLRWEAYELQQRIMLQRLQAQELQQKFGARTDLINRYLADPSFRELMARDPNIEGLVRYGVANGATMEQIDKAIGLHRYMTAQDSTDAGTSRATIAAIAQMTGQPYDKTYMPIRGPQTAAAAAEAQAAQEAAKNAEIERGKLLGGATKLAPGETLVGPGVSPTGISPLSITVDPTTLKPSIGLGGTISASGAARTPSASDTPPVSPAAQAAPASSGSGAQMNSGQAGSSTVGGAMVTGNTPGSSPVQPGQQPPVPPGQTLPVGSVSGLSPVSVEAEKGRTTYVQADVNKTLNQQRGINTIESIVNDVRSLQKLTQTGGWGGQAGAAWRDYLQHHWGMSPTDASTAQTAISSLLVDTLARVRQEMGLTTVRVGEIDPIVKPTLGSASMPPGALDMILAQELSGAQVDKKNVDNALAYYRGDYGALGSGTAEATYLQNKQKNENDYGLTRDKNSKDFNTIVEQAKNAPAPDTGSPASMGGIFPAPPVVPPSAVPPPAVPPPAAPPAPNAPPSAPAVVARPETAPAIQELPPTAAPPPAAPPVAQPREPQPDFVFSGGKLVPASPQQ